MGQFRFESGNGRMEEILVSDHQNPITETSVSDKPPGFYTRQRKRFFHEDIFPGIKTATGQIVVGFGWRGDDRHAQLRILKKPIECRDHREAWEFPLEVRSNGVGPWVYYERNRRKAAKVLQEDPSPPAAADETDLTFSPCYRFSSHEERPVSTLRALPPRQRWNTFESLIRSGRSSWFSLSRSPARSASKARTAAVSS